MSYLKEKKAFLGNNHGPKSNLRHLPKCKKYVYILSLLCVDISNVMSDVRFSKRQRCSFRLDFCNATVSWVLDL